ncbi:MAG: ABC transporter permease subunit [Clostridiaceae bacterium]
MIKREIMIRLKSIFIWILGFAFMIIGGMTKFDVFGTNTGDSLNQFIRSMPRIMRVLYGMEGIDISTFSGYFGILLLYVLLMVAVHGAFIGTSLLHLEFKERTADFLFVKPRSRDNLLLRKLFGGVLVILIVEAAIAACCYYVFMSSGELELLPKTLLAIALTHLFFFALGFFLTIVSPKSKQGQQISLIVVLLAYLSITLSQLYNQEWILNFNPIGWFNRHIYSATPATLGIASIVMAGLILIMTATGVYVFRHKDIPS